MSPTVSPVPWEHLEALSLPEDHALLHAFLGERLTAPLPTVEALLGAAPRLALLRLGADPASLAAASRGDLLARLQLAGGGEATLRLGGDLVRALLGRLDPAPGAPRAPLPVSPAEAGLLGALLAAALRDLAGGAAALDDLWAPDPGEPRGALPAAPPPALALETRWAFGEAHGGWLRAALSAEAAALLRRAARESPPPVAAARAAGLPLAFAFVAAEATYSAAEVAGLLVGDVLAFPHAPPAGTGRVPGWIACDGWRHPAALERTPEGRQLTVLAEEISMSDHDLAEGTPAAPAPGPGPQALLERLPVRVSVTLGTVTLSAADVTRLAPGAVIALEAPLGGPVEVHAGGKAIARGELVTVDGALGVRLTALLP